VLIVQDHTLLGSTLAEILKGEEGMNMLGVVRTGAEAADIAFCGKADVVLMDFDLPDMGGPSAAARIKTRIPEVAIVFHSVHDSETAFLDAIDAGATACLARSATTTATIIEAVRRAGRGEVSLPVSLFAKAIARRRSVLARQKDCDQIAGRFTARELDVLKLIAKGLDTTTISTRLGIARHTFEWHARHVMEKLEVHSKLQAVIAAAHMGLIDLTAD
jgi:DNA-binding NarL/FixJ family response regulator